MRIAHPTRDTIPVPAVLAAGWGSVALGIGALVLVVAAPAPAVAVLAGTAGIVAAATGLAVLKARAPATSVPAVGITVGALAALLLVAQLGTTLLNRADGARPVPRPAAVAAPTPSRTALAGAVTMLAYLLSQARGGDGDWPASLAVTDDGRVFATAGPNVGHLLLQAPAGATVSYVVSADRSRCVLTMAATADPSLSVRFSSTKGLSTND
jgi:hypothetical protein